ncbi:MAG: 3-oxoacyl-[acyl-carrier protein] reductase [Planctomycetota bacterium]|jgi:3-oxoacyl-[acyl-carrier protein] reductase
MDLELEGAVIFITGASGGIGRAMAEVFAAEGARVALHGHRQWEALESWLGTQSWRENAMAVRADITSPSEIDEAFKKVKERWGRVDVCIANAGIWPPEELPLHLMGEDRIHEVMGINLLGAIWTARAFMKMLADTGPRADARGSCLLFTGSTAARFGEKGHSDYAASKAALSGLMMSLKNEIVQLDPFGRVNIVEPGWTVTEMTRRNIHEEGVVEKVVRTMPVKQLARAVDIARTALYLASPAGARHVSGQVVTVAGGMEGRVLWEEDEVDAKLVLQRLAADS